MGLHNEGLILPPVKNGDVVKIEFTATDIRVADIRPVYYGRYPRLQAKFQDQYIFDVEENELYYLTNDEKYPTKATRWAQKIRGGVHRMGALSTWQVLGLYRLQDDGYLPYYWWQNV